MTTQVPTSSSVLVLLSGGLDSAVLTTHTLHDTPHVETLAIHYGQTHHRELHAAHTIAQHLGLRHDTINLETLQPHLTSSLTGHTPIPHGHYTDSSMTATVVPNRNAIMLMVAAGIAASRGHTTVAAAMHAGDHPIYPDCRPEFATAANLTSQLATGVTLHTPYIHLTKTDIASIGDAVKAPMHLSWSCYEGDETHCGQCSTCIERQEAFRDADIPDPTVYKQAAA